MKTRVIARNQQVVRVDRERPGPLAAGQLDAARRFLTDAIAQIDGVIIADYGKGFVSQEIADAAVRSYAGVAFSSLAGVALDDRGQFESIDG